MPEAGQVHDNHANPSTVDRGSAVLQVPLRVVPPCMPPESTIRFAHRREIPLPALSTGEPNPEGRWRGAASGPAPQARDMIRSTIRGEFPTNP